VLTGQTRDEPSKASVKAQASSAPGLPSWAGLPVDNHIRRRHWRSHQGRRHIGWAAHDDGGFAHDGWRRDDGPSQHISGRQHNWYGSMIGTGCA